MGLPRGLWALTLLNPSFPIREMKTLGPAWGKGASLGHLPGMA